MRSQPPGTPWVVFLGFPPEGGGFPLTKVRWYPPEPHLREAHRAVLPPTLRVSYSPASWGNELLLREGRTSGHFLGDVLSPVSSSLSRQPCAEVGLALRTIVGFSCLLCACWPVEGVLLCRSSHCTKGVPLTGIFNWLKSLRF